MTCAVETCERATRTRGLCNAHYLRLLRRGTTEPERRLKGKHVCGVEGCSKPHRAYGYCSRHSQRFAAYGDPEGGGPARRNKGDGSFSHGYVVIQADGKKKGLHRIVMEEFLKRELLPGETVHHKNGVRNDNRLENLELWTGNHPTGSRVSDKVQWAKELLALYEPEALA